MPEHPITPIAITRYDTVSQRSELLDGPAATPYRFNWRAVHGAQLAADFKLALKKLEGLLYVLSGGQPDYANGLQWYARENPRCRWLAEQWWQQPSESPPPDAFWNYQETAALGTVRAGVLPSVPIRSRSGDPHAQFKRAQHSAYFPVGSVGRSHASFPFDPTSTFKQFPAWPDAEDVTVQYTVPAGRTATAVTLVSTPGSIALVEVSPGVWEGTIEAQTQGAWIDWYLAAEFADDPGHDHYEPYVSAVDGVETAPTLAGPVIDPEHGRAADAAYSFVHFSHYNPYVSGLPELLDENEPHEPGNWLRRGTDAYRFDSSENIQPGLINLARFALDYVGALVHHHPRARGSSDLCCFGMPIQWRWSGANVPDLYRGGGKGGTAGSTPLHNHPDHVNAGSVDARRSWRGIEMAWQNAGDVPGFFPDNSWYGDTESWLIWPSRLEVEPDPLNPPFEALIRDYGGRGLRAGDAIDPVHLLEIIDAVDYLISNGLWVQTATYSTPRSPGSYGGVPCGTSHSVVTDSVDGEWYNATGVDPNCTCAGHPRPSWEECVGNNSKCVMGRTYRRGCHEHDFPAGGSWDEAIDEATNCDMYNSLCSIEIEPLNSLGGWIRNLFDDIRTGCTGIDLVESTASATFGESYYFCGPRQTSNGPVGDDLHGNGYTKDRWQADGINYSVNGPSMGNRFADGSVTTCARVLVSEPTPNFETVTAVEHDGIGGPWWMFNVCNHGRDPDYSAPPPIPGLGPWNLDGTTPLYSLPEMWDDPCDPEGIVWPQVIKRQMLLADVAVPAGCSDSAWVAIDLNLQGGIPTLYDFNLNIADPFDDCPCKTWTGPGVCL